MRQFINTKNALVTEAIDGFLRGGEGRLARLDGYPHIKVVVRTDWDRSKVALVSGGGSGHSMPVWPTPPSPGVILTVTSRCDAVVAMNATRSDPVMVPPT